MNATLVKTNRPFYIIAEYLDIYTDDSQNLLKNIEVSLEEFGSYVNVRVVIGDSQVNIDPSIIDVERVRFLSSLDELWENLGVSFMRTSFSKAFPGKSLPYGRLGMMLLLLIVCVTPISIGVLYSLDYGTSAVGSFNVFSDFGFSFCYPQNMVLESSSLDGLVPVSQSEGKLIGQVKRGIGQKEGIILQWVKMPGPGYDKTVLPDSLDVDVEGVSYLSPVKEMKIRDLEIYYRSFILNSDGDLFCHMGVWYVPGQEKIYLLMYTNTKNVTAPVFFNMIESFEFEFSVKG